MGEYSIKETKELVSFIIKLGESIDKSLEDNKISFIDMSNFVSAMLAANSAFSDISKVADEINDLSKEESEELYSFIAEEFDLANDKVEGVIERALEIGMKIYHLVLYIRGDKAAEATAPEPTPA